MFEMLKRTCVIAAAAAWLTTAFTAPASAQSADKIRIGAAISLSGNFAREGAFLRDGYDLWKEAANKTGGIRIGGKPHQIEIIYYDDESNPQTSARLTQKLLTEDKVDFLFGPYSSGIATATVAISERYKTLTLTPMATANSLYARGYKYVFTPSPLANTGLHPILNLANTLDPRPKKVAIVGPDDLFPNITAGGAEEQAKKLGFEVVFTGKYPKGATDLSAVATTLKSKAADIILATGYTQDSVLLVKALRDLQVSPAILGLATAIGVPDLREALGEAAEGVMGCDYWVPTLTFKDPLFKDSATFDKMFKAAYNKAPTHHAASGAAAGVILMLAIEKADSRDSAKVREALLHMKGESFFGEYAFNDNGVNELATLSVSQISNGQPVVIFPKAVAQREPIYPRK